MALMAGKAGPGLAGRDNQGRRGKQGRNLGGG